MKHLTATDAARRFSQLLDSVEHAGETFLIVRHGRGVARIGPAHVGSGRAVKKVFAAHTPDPSWAGELRDLRRAMLIEEPHWNG